MATPEGKVKDKIRAVLKKHGVYWHCPVQNGMGSPTLDFVCCFRGRYLAIEAKAGKKFPTERQELTIESIRDSGGWAFTVNETEEYGVAALDSWLIAVSKFEEKQDVNGFG